VGWRFDDHETRELPRKTQNPDERIKMPKRGVNWAFLKNNYKN
jgi:hypothetical protein